MSDQTNSRDNTISATVDPAAVKLTFPFKVRLPAALPAHATERVKKDPAVKSLMPASNYTGAQIRIMGLPFGGHVMGRDSVGEAFYDGTEVWLNEGDTVPLTYYHGFGPDDPWDWQETPAVIGLATYRGIGSMTTPEGEGVEGHMFDAVLDPDEELGLRVQMAIKAGRDVRASSGAVGHLVRYGTAGLIDVWPVGELAVFDTNEWRLPANLFAVVEKKTTVEEGEEPEQAEPEARAAARVKGVAEGENVRISVILPEEPEKEFPMNENENENEQGVTPMTDYEAMAEAMRPVIRDVVSEEIKALAGEPPLKTGLLLTAPNLMTHAHPGDPDPEQDFYGWVRTGKARVPKHIVTREVKSGGRTFKGALQEGYDSEGGYLVPADVLLRIIEKRSEQSLLDRLGATAFTTDRDKFNIPTEGTSMTKFTIVAEEGDISAAENEPTFGQVAVTLYKFMKLVKVSTELMEDFNSGLEPFLEAGLGRSWAATENYYCQVGAGSTQPKGVFVGGTAGLTLDAAAAIGASEVPELIGKLKTPYRDRAVLVMNRTTAAYLAGLTGNPFQYRNPPVTQLWAGGEDLGIGYPVVPTEDAAAIAASAKSLLFGNFSFYGWVRNRSLRVQRLVELYAGTGQIGILAHFRAGGDVLQAEAFQYASHPSA